MSVQSLCSADEWCYYVCVLLTKWVLVIELVLLSPPACYEIGENSTYSNLKDMERPSINNLVNLIGKLK
jgi:hypothetical protein